MSATKIEVLLARRLFRGSLWKDGERAKSWWGVGQVIREMNDRGWTVEVRVSGSSCEVICHNRRVRGAGVMHGVKRQGDSTQVPAVVAVCALAALGEKV